jgi:hypothetical protein
VKPLESEKFGPFTVEIHFDDNSQDPREWGHGNDLPQEIIKQWQEGEVYGYVVKENDVEIDSLWSIYSIEDCYTMAQENFPTRNDQYYFDCYENQ